MATLSAADRRRKLRALRSFGRADGWTGRTGGRRWRAIRRAGAVLCLVAAAWSAVQVPEGGRPVLTVTRDLPLGAVLAESDLHTMVTALSPEGALTEPSLAAGSRLASPIRRGEILTDVRLVGSSTPRPGPGRVALTVRPADPAIVAVLEPGALVSVLGLSSEGGTAALTDTALVLGVLGTDGPGGGPPAVLLAVPIGDVDAVSAGTLAGEVALRVH